ncbi:MAG: hypothetical protein R6U91_04325 [Bacillota bacterium]
MLIKKISIIFFILIVLMVLFIGDFEEVEEEQLPPEGSSAEGTKLETGKEIDEESNEIVEVETGFKPNEDFYFSFLNDEPFDEEEVRVKLLDTSTGDVLAEEDYGEELEPETKIVYDQIWFGDPGRYKIVVEVGGEERAWQEVIIEKEEEE